MPVLLIKIIEIALPPLIQLVVRHYEKKDDDQSQAKAQAHKDALDAIKGNK